MKTCFVVSPIGEPESKTKVRSDKLLEHIIIPVCKELGLDTIRADQIHDSDQITDTVIKYLKESDLVISDLTNQNPNVFFETGFRKAIDRPLIMLVEKGSSLPFDVSATRVITYNFDVAEANKAASQIRETIKTIEKRTALEESSETNNVASLTGIVSILFEVKDAIRSLHEEINKRDADFIDLAVKQSSARPRTQEEIITEALFPCS